MPVVTKKCYYSNISKFILFYFCSRFNSFNEVEKFLSQLSDEVALRLTKIGNSKGKQITLKVMVRAENAPAGKFSL